MRSAVSDAAANLLSFVPSLGTREVLAFGEGVALPTRLRFKEVPAHQLPRSESAISTVPSVAAGHDMHFVGAVLERWRGEFQVREKGRFDLVTEADVGSQQAIRGYLEERFPDHCFLGEEGEGAKSRPGPDAPPTWVVYPLDGTTNYVHDCPLYCVSIGLQEIGRAHV